ncbi:TnsA-like heteromeric transposase endonuclease subunit [Kitasatospora sp. NPDC017646]|uniref:TnsA-like heteromeric transposase endonuclease subunit n=1 Tax=Kitasatospora sp. NPDC017646 TaxID=3364024 RepID=UPI0037A9746A
MRSQVVQPLSGLRGSVMVHFCDEAGDERLVAAKEAAEVPFEHGFPVRSIPSYKGQRHTPGSYWSASTGRMVEYESFLESQWMTLLDFDPRVAAFVSQPMTLLGEDEHGRWSHVPDLFARRFDGSVLLVDVKAGRFADVPKTVLQRERTAAVCDRLGWDYEMVSEPDPLRLATVSWLAGYRRPLHAGEGLVDALMTVAQNPVAFGDLVAFQAVPEVARAVAFHLMWRHQLVFDMSRPLADSTWVRAVGGVR